MADRREALKIIGAIGSTCAFPFSSNELYAQHVHEGHGAQAPAGPPRFFIESQMNLIGAIADRIIPPTDTPGAVGAGVPAYVDFVVSRNQTLQEILSNGLIWIDDEAKQRHGKGSQRPLPDYFD